LISLCDFWVNSNGWGDGGGRVGMGKRQRLLETKKKKPFATLASANFSQVGITESEKIG
jgi:hypothetical protein